MEIRHCTVINNLKVTYFDIVLIYYCENSQHIFLLKQIVFINVSEQE